MVLSSLLQSADGETEARLGSLWLQLRDSGDEKNATPLRGSLGETKVPCEPGRPGEGRPVGRFHTEGKTDSTAEGWEKNT